MIQDYAPPNTNAFRFCPQCGGKLSERLLESDSRPRLVCDLCGYIFYLNPKVVAATIPVRDGRVVLGRRGIEPRRGAWTFPSGFVELGETVEEAALRETKEEVDLDVQVTSLLNVYSRPTIGIVVVVFVATIPDGDPGVGAETLEVRWFKPAEIPWDELAFDSTVWALRDWVKSLGLPPRSA